MSSKASIASDFATFLRIKQGESENDAMRNRISDFDSTKNQINKLAMNNRRLLIAAEFYFVHPVEKVKNITSWHKTLSASAVKVNKIQDAA